MEPEAKVRGRVVTKLPGVTISGLTIGLHSTNDSIQIWRQSQTDAEGRFEMRGLPAGKGNIFLFDHPSDGPWAYRAVDSLPLQPGETVEVTLELIEGVLVEGKAIDAGTGDPVVGLSVGMYGAARPRSGAAILSAKTDDMGRYRFRLPPGKTHLYVATAEYVASVDQAGMGPDVTIPADTKTFTAPTFKVRKK
jgi:hypothetical protein